VSERDFYDALLVASAAVAAVVFVALFFITAPYGRHQHRRVGPQMPSWLGWLVMEAPAALLPLLFLALGTPTPGGLALLGIWELHYVNRAFVYPFRRRSPRPMPLLIVLGGIAFNLLNGYLNGRWLFTFGIDRYSAGWLIDPRFVVGVLVFAAGFFINQQSDAILMRLRAETPKGEYRIPRGGLFERVSSPNYLGEILEWLGFAIASWSPAGALFALWTFANLAPRAISNHRWYRQQFPDYPKERKALVPFVI
jgi:protein-S-isoprenylcysteine O-methyltransferase Ste14